MAASLFGAIPDGKPFHTFPGIALDLFGAIPDGKPFHTFPGIALDAKYGGARLPFHPAGW
jgi:hypothetical protein